MKFDLRVVIVAYLAITLFYMFIKFKKRLTKPPTREELRKGVNSYDHWNSVPVISIYISGLRRQLLYKDNDESLIRYQVSNLFKLSVVTSISIFGALFYFLASDIYMIMCIAVVTYIINNVIIESFTTDSINSLQQLKQLINNHKHNYHKYRSISKALLESSREMKGDIAIQSLALYNALRSGTYGFEYYLTTCTNKFFKLFANLCYLTKEYGDRDIDGVSYFVQNGNYLIEEIQIEYVKKKTLIKRLKIDSFISIFPVILPRFLEKFMLGNFPASGVLLKSSYGYFARISIVLISAGFYYIIKQYQDDQDKVDNTQFRDSYWEEDLMQNKWVGKICNIFIPRKDSNKYKKLDKIISNSGTSVTVGWLVLRKLLIFTLIFGLSITLLIGSHKLTANTILNNAKFGVKTESSSMFSNSTTDEDKANDAETVANDKKILAESKALKKSTSEYFKDKSAEVTASLGAEKALPYIDRIQAKITAIQEEHMHWYDILLALIFSLILSNFPVWVLKFKSKIRMRNTEDEVFQFQTIIIMLMHHDRVSNKLILKWMEKFADVFKDPIRRALNSYSSGPAKALEELKNSANVKPFQELIDGLVISVNSIKINKAFNSLEMERGFSKNERSYNNHTLLEDRIAISNELGKLPLIYAVLVYLFIPIAYMMVKEAMIIYPTLSKLTGM